MDVYVNGKTKVTLGQREFRGQGGEGAVYVRQDTAFKVYTDPSRALPAGKIQELSPLSLPNIVKPEALLTDRAGIAVGYTMRAVASGVPLCQAFNKAFRDRHQWTPDRTLALVERMRDGVRHVHACGLLVVDLNEMNFLLSADLSDVYFIDVDSYQTPHFPATAIMESVRDRHASRFSPGSDWFSFAVVSFQLFLGVHPYKGKHPNLKTLDERMRANVSALNPVVSLPGVCPPLSVLPKLWRDWYEAVLERGIRVAPPDGTAAVVASSFATVSAVPVGGRLEFRPLGTFDGEILDVLGDLVLTSRAVYAGGRKLTDVPNGVAPHLGRTPLGVPVLAWLDNGQLRLRDARRGMDILTAQCATEIAASGGRLYARHGDALLEITFAETPAKTFAQARPAGNVLEQATQLLPGVALQNLLGAWYASLLPRAGVCVQVRLRELDGARVLDARFEGGVLVVATAKDGSYHRHVFRFDDACREYDARVTTDVERPEVDFTVLDTGVCLLRDGEALELFSRKRGEASLATLTDAALGGVSRLYADGAQARASLGGTLTAVRMTST